MLATLAELKNHLGVTDSSEDAVLGSYLSSADSQAKRIIGRDVEKKAYEEELDGHGESIIQVRNFPIISIEYVKFFDGSQWVAIDSSEYSVKKASGLIRFRSMSVPRGFGNVSVKYEGGYDPVPEEISGAVVKIAAASYWKKGADGIKREKLEGAEIEYAQESVPQDMVEILSSYRSIDV